MQRLVASTGLHFNHDIRLSTDHLRIFHDQLLVTIIETLLIYNEGFEDVAKHPSLQHQPISAIQGHNPQHFLPAQLNLL
jgi:hypothetical protein